jgi:hypothetical protein
MQRPYYSSVQFFPVAEVNSKAFSGDKRQKDQKIITGGIRELTSHTHCTYETTVTYRTANPMKTGSSR